MMDDQNPVVEALTQDVADGAVDTDVVEDVLVEEVSIDGMCGVY